MNLKNVRLPSGGEQSIAGVGTFVYVTACDAPVKVKGHGINVILKAGQGVTTIEPFTSLDIINTVAAANSIDIVTGTGEFFNAELSGAVDAAIAQASTITQSAEVVALVEVELVAADAATKFIMIQNLGATDIFIGGAGVTAATGIKVASGASFLTEFAAAAAWAAIAASGSNDVRVIKGV